MADLPSPSIQEHLMIFLSADSASELFAVACAAVLSEGREVAPRGISTRELMGVHLRLKHPRRRLVATPPARVLNAAFAAAETVWILSGSDDPWIYTYNQRLPEFADDGVLRGAYGPRLRRWDGVVDQLDRVSRLLESDPDTRRAVIQLYNPGRVRNVHRDVPCTLGYRFYLRQGRLDMHTSMRSQDLWLGFGYDIFAATVLHELVAGWASARLGDYNLHVDSLHLYDDHLDAAADLPAVIEPSPVMPCLAIAWHDFDPILREVIAGGPVEHTGWREVGEVMRAYRMWRSGRRAEARRIAEAFDGPLAVALRSWFDHLAVRRSA
jgi:thymidylate synthase